MKKFFIHTFGCQMNIYDGQRIAAMLTARDMVPTDKIADADIIILNTCSVREKATNKVFSALGRIRDEKKPDALFGIVGCVARESGADAFRRIPELNFVLGPQSYHKLPVILDNPDAKLLNIDLSGLEKFDVIETLQSHDLTPSQLAYIPIQEGCDHCCTYCIVPFTRGRELSRPYADVMTDVINSHATEICFLGQNVNGYSDLSGPVTLRLSDLIRETAKIDSVRRIRFTSSYPTNFDDDLISCFRDVPKLLPFLNMPIQSGSDRILQKMNRHYSVAEYLEIVEKIHRANNDVKISSDFIVGFPGETDDNFAATCDIARRAQYINSYSFKYSPRPHTAAALLSDQIPENIKRERLRILDDILTENNRIFNESCVGRIMDCLIEGPDKTGGHLLCRSPYMQQVIIPHDLTTSRPHDLIKIKITSANKCSLRGEIV